MPNINNSNLRNDKFSQPMTTGAWIKTRLLLCIPLLNIILVLVWAFGSNVNISKKNYYRASLILGFISFIIFAGSAVALFIIFPDKISEITEQLRNNAPKFDLK